MVGVLEAGCAAAAGTQFLTNLGLLLRADLEQLADPARKSADRHLTKFLDLARPTITTSTLLASDTSGDARYIEFWAEATRLFNKGLAEGKEPLDLVDPKHADYIGSILPKFQRTIFEEMDELSGQLRITGPEDEAVKPLRRSEGESAEDFAQRVLSQGATQ